MAKTANIEILICLTLFLLIANLAFFFYLLSGVADARPNSHTVDVKSTPYGGLITKIILIGIASNQRSGLC